MSEWQIALIAAGAAVLGSAVTGFFAWKAGHRQAAAAEAAGHAQAGALVSTVQATLDEQRRARAAEQRRQTYAQMITAVTRWKGRAAGGEEPVIQAYNLVRLEGPAAVAAAARDYMDAAKQMNEHWDEAHNDALRTAENAFIHASQNAIRDA
jgi:hypothetical protein